MKLKLAIFIIAIVCIMEAIYYPLRDFLPVDMGGEGDIYYKVVVNEEVTTDDYIDIGLYILSTALLILLTFLSFKTSQGEK